jgi:hypothetical protein
MASIFISHVHEEGEVAEALLHFLRNFDLDVYLSSEYLQIDPGERWFDRVISELTDAKVVLLLISSRSVNRPWINFEARWAWGTQRKVVPVCFGGLDRGSMPRPYSDLQGVNLKTDYYQILKACDKPEGVLPPAVAPQPNTNEGAAIATLIQKLGDFESR